MSTSFSSSSYSHHQNHPPPPPPHPSPSPSAAFSTSAFLNKSNNNNDTMSQHLNDSYNHQYQNNSNNVNTAMNTSRNQQQQLSSSSTSSRSASPDGGLSGLAAQLDAINPMFKSMRDLERRKQQEVHTLEDRLHQKDLEISRLQRQVEQLKHENFKLKSSLTDHPLSASGGHGHQQQLQQQNFGSSSSPSTSFQYHHQSLTRERQVANSQAHVAGTNLGTALSPKQMNVPRHHNGNSFTTATSENNKSNLQHQNYQTNTTDEKQQQQKLELLLKKQQKEDQERQELEEMLSRSISRLADAERALVSERTRFLVVDPGLISMERWRAAVSRLADLHDEVAHRRFGACLAAARLSGQLPDDLPQVTATQFLRASLSPVVLQMIANCFRKKEKEEERLMDSFKEMENFGDDVGEEEFSVDGNSNYKNSRSSRSGMMNMNDPWRNEVDGLTDEPDVLLHHVNCILERLTIDPGDDYVQ